MMTCPQPVAAPGPKGLAALGPGELVVNDSCYLSPVLTTLKTVRYMKHTCTLTKLHILASKYKV